jgi:predicted ATPase
LALKLKRISISGFKALDGFSMSIAPKLTLLVGINGAGKSSILQALAFARHLAEETTSSFFREREWDRKSLRFKSSGNRRTVVTFQAVFHSSEWGAVRWIVGWGLNGNRLWSESLQRRRTAKSEPEDIISFQAGKGGKVGTEDLPSLTFPGSLLPAVQSLEVSDEQRGVTGAVLKWLLGIQSLELLSPLAMKGGTRISPDELGIRGERLAGFLAALTTDQKDRVVQRMGRFYPLQSMDTVRKRAGWIDLLLHESYTDFNAIQSAQMSDGFMRMLALCAIPELGDTVSLILLDEIEDGIEPHILAKLIMLVTRESRAQIIATTHSPLLANVVGLENIRFISRTDEGRSIAAEAVSMPALSGGQDFLGPGEMWANTDMRVLRSQAVKSAAALADGNETGTL